MEDQPHATPISMVQFNIQLGSTGRPVIVSLPADVADVERFDLAAWVCSPDLTAALANHAPASPIIVPTLVRPS